MESSRRRQGNQSTACGTGPEVTQAQRPVFPRRARIGLRPASPAPCSWRTSTCLIPVFCWNHLVIKSVKDSAAGLAKYRFIDTLINPGLERSSSLRSFYVSSWCSVRRWFIKKGALRKKKPPGFLTGAHGELVWSCVTGPMRDVLE